MRILVLIAAVVVSGLVVDNYVLTTSKYNNVAKITDLINQYPVDLFKFKEITQDYTQHLCYKNEAILVNNNVSVGECIAQYDAIKTKCTDKVFRLAPLNIDSEKELIEYSNEYSRCTLPYKNMPL